MNPNNQNTHPVFPNDPNRPFPTYPPDVFAQNPNFQQFQQIPSPHPNPSLNPDPMMSQAFAESQYAAYVNFLNPNTSFGLSQPETVPETQPNRVKRKSKKKQTGKNVVVDDEPRVGTRKKWTTEENICLVRACIEILEDSVVANYIDGEGYYKKVHDKIIKLMKESPDYRDVNKVGSHFRDINKKIQLYQAIHNRITNGKWSSGKNDLDIEKQVKKEYKKREGCDFNLFECWELLKGHVKWLALPQGPMALSYETKKHKAKRSKTTETSSPNLSTPSDAHNLDLNDDPVDDPFDSGDDDDEPFNFPVLARPLGRRSDKNKRAGSSSTLADEGENHVSDRLQAMFRENINENKLNREQFK